MGTGVNDSVDFVGLHLSSRPHTAAESGAEYPEMGRFYDTEQRYLGRAYNTQYM